MPKQTKTKKPKPWTPTEKDAWRMPPDMTVSEWADQNIYLPARAGPEPGRYRTDRTPYMRKPQDAFGDPDVERIDLVMAAQTGKTVALYNMIAYAVANDPSPAMLVMPKEDDFKRIIANRLKPTIELSPAWAEHVGGRTWDLSSINFFFDRMTLYFGGANSPADLAQVPIRFLFFDEIDKYPLFSGRESAPVALAEQRTANFWDRKIVKACTPTTETNYLWSSWKQSNQEEYYIPCRYCGRYQIWEFGQLKIRADQRDPDAIRQEGDIWIECRHCGKEIREEDKEVAVAAGVWVPAGQKIDINGKIIGKEKQSRHHSGFKVSRLVSPWTTWREIMAEWFEANTTEGIAIGRLMAFRNQVLAEVWRESAKEIAPEKLRGRVGKFTRGTLPTGAKILVAAADFHMDYMGNRRIDYQIQAFGYGETNWVISYGSADSWEQLEDEVLFQTYINGEHPKGLAVRFMLVDSGYKPDEVYSFCQKHFGLVWPVRGAPGRQATPVKITNLEKAKTRGRRIAGLSLFTVDTDFFKTRVHTWAEKVEGEPGATTWYAEIPDRYFEQFTNEHRVKTHDRFGRTVWTWKPVKPGAETHALDLAVYSAAAAYYMRVQYLRRPISAKTEEKTKEAPPTRGRRPSGFLQDLPRL